MEKLNNEELNEVYCSPVTLWVIKLRRMRWAGHVTSMEKKGVYRVLVGKPEGIGHLGDPGLDGRLVLR